MSVKDGLLVLLSDGPAHGYELKRVFEGATGGQWPLNIGQVYSSLQRLERDGLIELDVDDGERKTYRLTLAGREHLEAWLLDPVARTTETRDEVAMKILLATGSARGDPLAVVRAQREATLGTLQHLTRQRQRPGKGGLARQLQRDRVALRCRAELDWLELVEERLIDAGARTDGKVDSR